MSQSSHTERERESLPVDSYAIVSIVVNIDKCLITFANMNGWARPLTIYCKHTLCRTQPCKVRLPQLQSQNGQRFINKKKTDINSLHINPFVIWTLLVANEPQVLYRERACPTYICNENNLILIKCHSGHLQESCSGGHCKPSKTAGYPETKTLGNLGSNLSSLIPCLELTLISQTENIFFLKSPSCVWISAGV